MPSVELKIVDAACNAKLGKNEGVHSSAGLREANFNDFKVQFLVGTLSWGARE